MDFVSEKKTNPHAVQVFYVESIRIVEGGILLSHIAYQNQTVLGG